MRVILMIIHGRIINQANVDSCRRAEINAFHVNSCSIEGDSYTQYKAMIICTGIHLLLFMFELLACDKLESCRTQVLWILVFIPLIFLSIISIGICVWAVKHERTFEVHVVVIINFPKMCNLFYKWPVVNDNLKSQEEAHKVYELWMVQVSKRTIVKITMGFTCMHRM